MKKITIILVVGFLLLLGSEATGQFATPLDSSDVAGWKFTTFDDVDDSLTDGHQIYEKIDSTTAKIPTAEEADSALAFTHQGIKWFHVDSTSNRLIFSSAYHYTSADVESMYMSKQYIDDAAGGLVAQSVKGDHVDSTAEDFVFADPYRGTSAEAESLLLTHGGAAATYVTATLTEEQVEDFVGGMLGGTETGIAVTYEDGTNDIDFVVDHDAANNFEATEHVDWAAGSAGTIHTDNYVEDAALPDSNDWSTAFSWGDHGGEGYIKATLTEEEVEDYVGGMLGGTETNISVAYNDGDNDIDFVVDSEPWDSTTSWGNLINVHEDSIVAWANKVNTALPLAGGTMTGDITMPDEGWIGLGTAKVEFFDEAADSIRMWCVLKGYLGYFTLLSTTSGMTVGDGFTVSAGAVSLPIDQIDAAEINWGTGGGQVSATDLPDFGTVTTTDDYILVADGTDFEGVAVTGDVAMDNGAITLGADVVDEAHIADDGIDSEHYNDGSVDLVHLAADVSEPWDSLTSWANKVNSNYDHSQDNTQAHTDYLLNSGNDMMGGILTADGLTLGENENITLGSQTLDHDGTDFVFGDDVTISGILVTSDTLTKAFVIQVPDTDHDLPLWMTPKAITLIAVSGVAVGGTNVVGVLMEYDNDAANPTVCNSSDWTFTTGEERTTSLSNASIDAGDWLGWKTTSVSGEVNFISITFEYTQP